MRVLGQPTGARRPWPRLMLLVAGAMASVAPAPAVGAVLAEQLRTAARELVVDLKRDGVEHVGVLKFLVVQEVPPEEPGAPVQRVSTDSAGLVNLNLADRLEVALILAVADDPNPLGVIRRASSTAEQLQGANWRTAAGRLILFGGSYTPAWGRRSVVPDAFLTGFIAYAGDGRVVTVNLIRFDRRDPTPRVVRRLVAETGPIDLVESGRSFSLRGPILGGTVRIIRSRAPAPTTPPVAAPEEGVRIRDPFDDPAFPVALEIECGGVRVFPTPISTSDPLDLRFRMPEPDPGQAVKFYLRRREPDPKKDPQTYAALLLVNGINTLYKTRHKPPLGSKWLLKPGGEPIEVSGFQTTFKNLQPFEVVAVPDPVELEMRFGEDLGLITLAVFGERPAPMADTTRDDRRGARDGDDLSLIAQGLVPLAADSARDARELMAHQARTLGTRGIIDASKGVQPHVVVAEPFDESPTPLMGISIRYYVPPARTRPAGNP